jgi:hypothetical protein
MAHGGSTLTARIVRASERLATRASDQLLRRGAAGRGPSASGAAGTRIESHSRRGKSSWAMRWKLIRLSGTPAGPAQDRAVVVWTLISPEVALLLIDQRGWTREQYGHWLGEAVAEQVHRLRPRPHCGRPATATSRPDTLHQLLGAASVRASASELVRCHIWLAHWRLRRRSRWLGSRAATGCVRPASTGTTCRRAMVARSSAAICWLTDDWV